MHTQDIPYMTIYGGVAYLSTQVEVAEQDGGLGAGDDQDNEDEEEEAKHVVHLVGPGNTTAGGKKVLHKLLVMMTLDF